MSKPMIQFRAASPLPDEGRVFAIYLDQAAEGFFRFMLGRRSTDIIARAFTEPNHDLSFQNVTFAHHDNRIVGMVSGYTAGQHRQSSDRPLKQAAGRFNLRMITVYTLFAPLFRIINTMGDDDFYVQAMAVDKTLRQKGIGSKLMDYVEGCARDSGSGRLSLDVSAANRNGRKLYERHGMTIESQWPKRLAIPGVKFYRMVKAL